MFARVGYKAIEFTTKILGTGVRRASISMTKSSDLITDTIQLVSERIKNLRLYNANGTRNHLFNFTKDGKLKVTQRVHGSNDLQFLDHVRTGQYVQPKVYPQGTLPCSKQGIEQSNKLAKDLITENEHFIDGYRYTGRHAKFDNFGKDVSSHSNGAEIVIFDRTIDKNLVKTIEAFKNRINNKNLTDEQKVDELMKFVDEVFSVSKSGSQTEKYVENIMKQETVEILFGDIINSGAGVCRHRALLTKVLADEIKLNCRMVQGYYNGGGHAWNEIITKSDTYLFDAMQGRICNVGNATRNLDPETFKYQITNPKNINNFTKKYLDNDSDIGLIYRMVKHKATIKTSEAILTPTANGYRIDPLTDNVLINGERITGVKELSLGDFVNLKDIGFQIV